MERKTLVIDPFPGQQYLTLGQIEGKGVNQSLCLSPSLPAMSLASSFPFLPDANNHHADLTAPTESFLRRLSYIASPRSSSQTLPYPSRAALVIVSSSYSSTPLHHPLVVKDECGYLLLNKTSFNPFRCKPFLAWPEVQLELSGLYL
jgi:hypothetical protein